MLATWFYTGLEIYKPNQTKLSLSKTASWVSDDCDWKWPERCIAMLWSTQFFSINQEFYRTGSCATCVSEREDSSQKKALICPLLTFGTALYFVALDQATRYRTSPAEAELVLKTVEQRHLQTFTGSNYLVSDFPCRGGAGFGPSWIRRRKTKGTFRL